MRLAVLFAVLLVAGGLTATSGCTHVQPLSLSSSEGRAAVTERAASRRAQLSLDGEPTRFVRDLRLDADSARWTDARTGRRRAEPTTRVRAVVFARPGRDAMAGAAVGAGVGAVAGRAIDAPFGLNREPLWIALNAVAGSGLGAFLGAMFSGADVYRR